MKNSSRVKAMVERLRAWWQRIREHWIIAIIIVTMIVIVLIFVGYRFDWTGFNGYNKVTTTHTISGPNAGTAIRTEEYQPGKALWDWLQLLIIPAALAITALWFNRSTTRTEQSIAAKRFEQEQQIAADRYKQEQEIAAQRYEQDQKIASKRYEQDQKIALDKQREDLLQIYLDRMSELLLKEKLRSSEVDAEVRNVARVRTITILFQLDSRRIGYVFAFLRESGLMSFTSNVSIVSFDGADLRKINFSQADLIIVNLHGANLSGANLSGANLFRAKLVFAFLSEANLSGANLIGALLNRAILAGAYLSGANLYESDLSGADLSGADLSGADLKQADLSRANLKGAIGITIEELEKQAFSLKDAIMPDGSIHL